MANRIGNTIFLILVLAFFSAVLFGCSAISSLPTMQHCQHVKYERTGTAVIVQAECTAPVGGTGL